MAGSQKVRQQREVTYEETRRGIYSSTIVPVLLVGPEKFMGSEEQEEMNHQNTSVNDKSTSKGSLQNGDKDVGKEKYLA